VNDSQRNDDSKEGRIALWPGRHREEGEKQPYLTGRLTINGQEYFVTLWKRKRESDRMPILSGNVTISIDEKLEV
jgi:hypothetical protein